VVGRVHKSKRFAGVGLRSKEDAETRLGSLSRCKTAQVTYTKSSETNKVTCVVHASMARRNIGYWMETDFRSSNLRSLRGDRTSQALLCCFSKINRARSNEILFVVSVAGAGAHENEPR
jgi:hypothetical protein